MAAIQVSFDPAIWSASGAGSNWGDNGLNCFSVWPDKDGTSLWAFEYFGAGWARVNAATGAIIHQDALFGTPGGSNFLDVRESGTVNLWAQDDAGHYYTGCYPNLYKFHIPNPSGSYTPDGTLLNGYAVIDATFDYHTHWGDIEDFKVWKSGGTWYLAGITTKSGIGHGTARIYVVNLDTMTFVGQYDGGADNLGTGNTLIVDSSGVLWGCCNQVPAFPNPVHPDAPPNDIGANLVRWNPADGATAGVLNNTTVQYIPSAVHGLPYTPFFTAYIPANNSIFLACFDNGNSTGAATVSMNTWSRVALYEDDLTFYECIEADSNEGGSDQGVVDGVFMVEGSNAAPNQVGGFLHIVDPTTLTIQSTIDCAGLITGASLPNPVETTHFNNTQNGYVSHVDEDASGNLTITTTFNAFEVGSKVLFRNLTGATWLNGSPGTGGDPPMIVTGRTPTQITGVDPFGNHGPYSGTEPAPYSVGYVDGFAGNAAIPPLSMFAWAKPSNRVGAVFNFTGSPLYIFPTGAAPALPARIWISVGNTRFPKGN